MRSRLWALTSARRCPCASSASISAILWVLRRETPIRDPQTTSEPELAHAEERPDARAPSRKLLGRRLVYLPMLASFHARRDGLEASVAEQCLIRVHIRVAGGEQLVSVEDGVGTGHEAQELGLAGEP